MLELRGITGGYGATTVLRDVSLSIPAGAAVALVGPNGAGKTTTLRTLSGLLRPSSGAVHFDGENITGSRPHQRARRGICHLTEGRGIFPSLTVRENLVLSAPRGQRTSESLELAYDAFAILGSRRRQVAGTLSGGEQQMLSLARAYIKRPRIILVDEASMGLAPKAVDAIFAFLARLRDEGVALLIVEQYVARALEIASSVYVLRQGQIVSSGAASALTDEDIFALYSGVEAAR